MIKPSTTSIWQWPLAIGIGVASAAIYYYSWTTSLKGAPAQSVPPKALTVAPVPAPQKAVSDSPALRYARAVQEGRCEEVIATTAWMAERIKTVRLESQDPARDEQVRQELCDRIQKRTAEGNQLRPEGVEDQYVFAPGAKVEWVGEDAGRDDLTGGEHTRTWLKVVFPLLSRALSDEDGKPIRSLEVGVNMSKDGLVLKANVIGNVEIDYASIQSFNS